MTTPKLKRPIAYAVEWRKPNGKWERLVGQRDNESQALEYARWFFKNWLEQPKIRCVEIQTATGSAPNTLTLKWGTLKGWDVKTPEAVALLKAYHEEPVSYSVMMQRDTPNQKETLIKLIDLCDEIWLDWEGKQVSRDDAKEYLRTYGQNVRISDGGPET
jgi:hypothetical protein